MATFILTWNPTKWPWEDHGYGDDIAATEKGLIVSGRWSVGGRKYGVGPGDQAILFRQHDCRGIVASGIFTSPLYIDDHWDGSGNPERYGDIEFDAILDPDDVLSVEILKSEVPGVPWDRLQGSGVKVPEASEDTLQDLWERHLQSKGRNRPAEVESPAESEVRSSVHVEDGDYVVLAPGVDDRSDDHEVWFVPAGVTSPRDYRNRNLRRGLRLPESLRLIADEIEGTAASS